MAQQSSGCLTICGILILPTVIVAFLQILDGLQNEPASNEDPRTEHRGKIEPTGSPVPPNKQDHPSDAVSFAHLEGTLTAAQRQRRSWENPFVPALWHSPGWIFDESAMRPPERQAAPATFRRPYKQLVLTLAIKYQLDFPPGGIAESINNTEPLLTIELLPRDSNAKLAIQLSEGRCTVSAVSADGSRQLALNDWSSVSEPSPDTKDPTERDTTQNDTYLAIALTPNRLMLRRNGRLISNIQRPDAITRTDCLVRFTAGARLSRISNMRFEGE